MNPLDVADLVVIAGKTLGLGTHTVLDQLDLGAAQTAVSEAAPAADSGDPALAAAALLAALVRHHPWDAIPARSRWPRRPHSSRCTAGRPTSTRRKRPAR